MQGGNSDKRERKERGARGDEVVTFSRKEEEELQFKLNARERREEGIEVEEEKEREGKGEKGWSVAVLTTDDTTLHEVCKIIQ